MIDTLDQILLCDNVTKAFHENYRNPEFRKWILSVLPEVAECYNLKQDNPWHIYNCMDHILHSVEEINKQSKDLDPNTRRMLAYTMFLHDIGKPQCYLRRYSKLYGREIDSFFDHNVESEKIAKRVLPSFGFNKQEQDIIGLLVHEHDIFMYITKEDDGNRYHKVLTNKLIQSYVNQYNSIGDGKEIMQYLVMVGRADSLAQNPEMTKKALELLHIIEGMPIICNERK